MKSKVVNRIPGKKAKALIAEKNIQETSGETGPGGEDVPKAPKAEDRKILEDKNRKFEARKEFEAAVRGRLKNSRKR